MTWSWSQNLGGGAQGRVRRLKQASSSSTGISQHPAVSNPGSRPRGKRLTIFGILAVEFHERKSQCLKEEHEVKMKILYPQLSMTEREMKQQQHQFSLEPQLNYFLKCVTCPCQSFTVCITQDTFVMRSAAKAKASLHADMCSHPLPPTNTLVDNFKLYGVPEPNATAGEPHCRPLWACDPHLLSWKGASLGSVMLKCCKLAEYLSSSNYSMTGAGCPAFCPSLGPWWSRCP